MTVPRSPVSVMVVATDPSCYPDLHSSLQGDGFTTKHRAPEGLDVILLDPFDVVVVTGLSQDPWHYDLVGELVRSASLPVVVLVAGDSRGERIRWLEVGADDVMAWPESQCELAPRLRNLVRRQRQLRDHSGAVIRVGELELRLEPRRAFLKGRELWLTDYEFRLLRVLARHPGRALSREQLLELARGSSEDSFDRSIDVRVSRLRSKLSDDPRHPQLLKTVRGVGYVLAAIAERPPGRATTGP